MPEAPQPAAPAPGPVTVRLPRKRPFITYTTMALTVLVFLLQMASQTLLGADWPAALGMKVNVAILAGQIWRLITPILLHGSLLHIGFNMYALYIFGPTLENFYGHLRYLFLYLIGGFAGNVISMLFSPSNSLGASSAIFGLLGAQAVFLYHNRQIFGGRAQRALVEIITIAGINLVIGLSPGIDNWGHLGGLLGGAMFAWSAGPLLQVEYKDLQPSLRDRRTQNEVIRAGAITMTFFSLLTVVYFYLQG